MTSPLTEISVPDRDEPYTIAELAKIADPDVYDNRSSMKDQLRAVEELRKKFTEFRQKGDIQNAFVSLARAASVVVTKLPTHPQYHTLKPEQKAALADNGQKMLMDVAEMKQAINDRHQQWVSQPHPPSRRSSQAESARRQEESRKREEAERIRRRQYEEEEARRFTAQEEARRQEMARRQQYEPREDMRSKRANSEKDKAMAMAKAAAEQETERVRPYEERDRRRPEKGQSQDRLRQQEALRQVENAARQAKATFEEDNQRHARQSSSTSHLAAPAYPTPASLTSSPLQPSAQPNQSNRSPISYVAAHRDEIQNILPLESPTRTRVVDVYAEDDRQQSTPSRASVRSVARSWSYPPPETTTSPPMPDRRRIEYPDMSDHQRAQGYIPSSSSIYAATPPSQLTTPQALLFQPNGVQPPPPPPPLAQQPPHPSMLYAHTLPHRSSMQSLRENYNAYPVAPPPPPPPSGPPAFIGFPDTSRPRMPEYPRHSEPFSLPLRPTTPPPPPPQIIPKASSPPDATTASGLRPVTLPADTLRRFLSIAAVNTAQNRETCGLLLGKLRNNTFIVSTLLVPRQTATSDTCTMTDEELVFDFQDKRELLTLGWIHTHPSQSCFMSSLDLHTQAGFQSMLPEAFAIVCAPKKTPQFGIFRLTDPPGLPMILQCTAKESFHPHPDMPIYTDADNGHVKMVEEIELEIIDLR